MTTMTDSDIDAESLLAELLEISDRHSSSRLCNTKTYVRTAKGEREFKRVKTLGEEHQIDRIDDSALSFLECKPEDCLFNQYWYSRVTIQCLCEAILDASRGKKIAFLSVPSLFFALPLTERKLCTLFDVSKFVSLFNSVKIFCNRNIN